MILDTVLTTIRRHAMLAPEDRVVVAVSGGPDSVGLLHILLELRPVLPLALTVAHLDHALRGDAATEDRVFSERLAARLGLPFRARRDDVAVLARRERRSPEEAGRIARRRFLQEVARQTGARRVALGHHRDDQAETVLLRLISGSGRGGLSGIRPVAGGLFVRPLLDCARAEILDYLKERNIAYRTDATNAEARFPRNRIRLEVLPLLKEKFNPHVAEAIARTADLLRDEDAWMDRAARRALGTLIVAPSSGWSAGPAPDTVMPQTDRRPTADTGSDSKPPGAASEKPTPEGQAVAAVRAGTVGTTAAGDPAAGEHAGTAGAAGMGHRAATAGPPETAAETVSSVTLDAPRLAALATPIGRRALRLALRHAGLRGRDLAKARIDEVLALARREETNLSLSLGESLSARLEYGTLILERVPGGAAGSADPGERADATLLALLPLPGEARILTLGLAIRVTIAPLESVAGEYRRAPTGRAYLDADLLADPLHLRAPGPGARFRPLGAPGTVKLSDLWTDLKVPREQRRRCLVVESGGRIVWAVGLRIADPFRVTEATRRVAILEALPLTGSRAAWPDAPAGARAADGSQNRAQTAAGAHTLTETHSGQSAAPTDAGGPPPGPGGRARASAFDPPAAPGRRAGASGSGGLPSEGDPDPRSGARATGSAYPAEASLAAWKAAGQPHPGPAARDPRLAGSSDESAHGHDSAGGRRPGKPQLRAESDPNNDLPAVLYSAEEIAAAVERLAGEVSVWAGGREVVVLGILHGSFIFMADLVRRMAGPLCTGFLDREGTLLSSRLVLRGARILLVEDILDTGKSLGPILERLHAQHPAEVRTCILFEKLLPARSVAFAPDFVGLPVPDCWVIGYGLDRDERDRNLPYLSCVQTRIP